MSADPAFLNDLHEVEDPLAAFDLFDDSATTASKKARFERIEKARKDAKSYQAVFEEPANSVENSHARPRTLVMAKLDYYYLHGDFARALDIGRQLLSTPDGDDSEVLDATLRCARRANVYDADLVELARRYKNYVRASPGTAATAASFLYRCPSSLSAPNEAMKAALDALDVSPSNIGSRRVLQSILKERQPVLAELVEEPTKLKGYDTTVVSKAIDEMGLAVDERTALERVIGLNGESATDDDSGEVGRNVRSL